ncbi:hypothetical protein [Streptomyces acidiscabies]|uniref:Uncharacterized protein n=1 Tax=Streptomyces acidiscabies TaxID=42234 RepID=A0ABU4MCW5_9ACTN|nr:hypothetical protein [Streptomyces acidiscabies]MDX3025652.1 hypothetical protein [Streptomyces acidiscabies]
MKLLIEHACDHAATADITGPDTHGQRARKAAWLAGQDCPDCSSRSREREHQEANARAVAESASHGWPDLVGTPRQAAWAATIRSETVQEMRDRLAAQCTPEAAGRAHAMWTAAALRQTDASWWIEHRSFALRNVTALLTPAERDAVNTAVSEGKTL